MTYLSGIRALPRREKGCPTPSHPANIGKSCMAERSKVDFNPLKFRNSVSSDKCFHHSITFMWMTPPAPPHGPNAHFHSMLWIFHEFIQAELDYIILHMKWDLSIPLQFLFILQLFRREVSFQESAVQFETLILARRRPWGRIAELWQGAAQLFTEKQSAPNSIW